MQGFQDISYAISQPRYTETHTSGSSHGGAQTVTNEVYEEHTITEGQAFTTGQNWSTAWAVDSSHAADLTFTYNVENNGTEYAREITGLVFNIYLGDDPNPIISYPAWQQFPDGKLLNVFPGDTNTFTSTPIPLTLDQMRRIDLGEPLTVVLEDFSFGIDELFYQDAVNGGLTLFLEDGVEDQDELVDTYVIPTWGTESVQDVLTRYFPSAVDTDGNLTSLWTPEFNGITPPTWNEHFLSEIAWWNIYQTCNQNNPANPNDPYDCSVVGGTSLQNQTARAGDGLLFRFNRDSDRDGYQDRVELRYGTDPNDPASHPQPEILAGYVTTLEGDIATVELKVANLGTFDAYGIDAVMYAPDNTVTIGNNTVGGNGRVGPGQQVAVGSLILPPDTTAWGSSTAQPYAGGSYTGDTDRVYTFTVGTPGVVGQGSAALNWMDSLGANGTLPLGSSYHAPLPITVTQGVYLGFDTGTLEPGTNFTVDALTPRDTFTYTVNTPDYTPPVIVLSFSDPQGSHRFITPVELTSLAEDLTPYR
ncbi:MAG TPA: thrombospondin type 3 repeat-containing protein, partial [Anaerolineales bacterium]|nr:thrombospondin type 3 repeat-containing protein [Anaerolineales bacterium]